MDHYPTPREWQIINLVAQGKQNKEIAFELFISEATAKVFITRLKTKLGMLGMLGMREFTLACERLSGCLGS